ncbi:hypothetical protein MMC13_006113 [Lambiella insularis]|nr:hypothetical protein [Lambiella insularis]
MSHRILLFLRHTFATETRVGAPTSLNAGVQRQHLHSDRHRLHISGTTPGSEAGEWKGMTMTQVLRGQAMAATSNNADAQRRDLQPHHHGLPVPDIAPWSEADAWRAMTLTQVLRRQALAAAQLLLTDARTGENDEAKESDMVEHLVLGHVYEVLGDVEGVGPTVIPSTLATSV